ncbi:SLAM family member 6 isoform X1 [Sus scrofa]|uniref:SLAM family member 6 isoform X1 n=1 Tax=Sus scrofa TaxID=9823 RepID=UPI000A2B685F|nr:SLAM family member 6 isoform X1 [Sus scrofa]
MIWLFQSLTLVFCLDPGNTVSQTSSTPLIVNGTLGESVTLPLKFPEEEKIMSITWLHDGKSIIFIRPNKAQSPLIHVTDPKQSNRLNVTKSYSLQLSNLTMADTGSYTAQITTTSVVFYSYYLRIFRRLGNLQVVTLTERSRNETCVIHLTCSVEDPNDNVSFSWQVSGSMLPSEANLTVSWDPKNFRDETYMCIAENPVSNASSSVSVQSLCKGVINAKNVHLDTRWIIMVVPLICIVIFACLCVRRKKLAGFLSSYLLLLQDSRDVESGASIRCCLGVPIMTQRCLSFPCSANPRSWCRDREELRICFLLFWEHCLCSGHPCKSGKRNPNTFEK